MRKSNRLPKEVFIYVCDILEDGTPAYAVANNVGDIPEDCHGEKVGNYWLNNEHIFLVRRELKAAPSA